MKSIKYISLWLGMCLGFCVQAMAQQPHTKFSISGIVKDSSNNAYIPYAHLTFISGSDTVKLSASTIGTFNLLRHMKEPILVKATAIGYKPYQKIHKPSLSEFKLAIRMQQDTVQLAEVIVIGKVIAVVMRGDTVQYNAGAFKTLEGDNLEKMILKMPGISYKMGKLTFNNEPITRILVDGTNIFGNTANTLENLKSSNVKRIDVYDKEKESDKALGMKYPRKEKEMNITTKNKAKLYQKMDFLWGLGREFPRPQLSEFPKK